MLVTFLLLGPPPGATPIDIDHVSVLPPIKPSAQLENFLGRLNKMHSGTAFKEAVLCTGLLRSAFDALSEEDLATIESKYFLPVFAAVFDGTITPQGQDAAFEFLLHVITSSKTLLWGVTTDQLFQVFTQHGLAFDIRNPNGQRVKAKETEYESRAGVSPEANPPFNAYPFSYVTRLYQASVLRGYGAEDAASRRSAVVLLLFASMDPHVHTTRDSVILTQAALSILGTLGDQDIQPLVAAIWEILPEDSEWPRHQFLRRVPGAGRGKLLKQALAFRFMLHLSGQTTPAASPEDPTIYSHRSGVVEALNALQPFRLDPKKDIVTLYHLSGVLFMALVFEFPGGDTAENLSSLNMCLGDMMRRLPIDINHLDRTKVNNFLLYPKAWVEEELERARGKACNGYL